MTREGGPSPIKALGEVALRVNDLPGMKHFYQDVLGLDVLGEFPAAVLLKIAEDYGGHTQVLGLFDRSVPVGPERTTVDHIAFTIALGDYESEKTRLEGLGLTVEVNDQQVGQVALAVLPGSRRKRDRVRLLRSESWSVADAVSALQPGLFGAERDRRWGGGRRHLFASIFEPRTRPGRANSRTVQPTPANGGSQTRRRAWESRSTRT